MDSNSQELLRIQPNELRFSFEANKDSSCSMQLMNRTNNHIAFKVKNNNPKRYCVQPNISIVPPRSTCNVNVTIGAQSQIPPDMQCEDKFLVQSVVVTERTTIEDLNREMFQKDAINVVGEVKLKVVYAQAPGKLSPVREGSDEGLSPRPSWSDKKNQDMNHASKKFLKTEPDALCFYFGTDKQLMCSMQLTNITADYVAFKVKNTNPKRYWVRPNISTVPPRSTCDVNVIMKAQEEAPPNMHCKDMFLVQSIVVREATTTNDLTDDMFKIQGDNVVDEMKLKVVYVQPTSPRQAGPEEGSLPHPSWSDGGNKNHQDTGSTLHNVTLQYLKDITKNFCNERILGKGGFSVVYKGVLGDGKMIAVKKLVQSISSSQDQKDFKNEVNLLMKLKHPNIVQLLSYCYETQYLHHHYEGELIFAENTQCLLCLEYLPNGSLVNYIKDASSGLDWPTRYRIIEGVSYGLQYLHEQVGGPVIHLDLKPGNILLDEHMLPKVTDFGLSRLNDKKETIHTKNISGTPGYMPPEYLQGRITTMSDIFSLGVIITEVITGHRNYPDDIKTSSTDFIELELKKWRDVLQKKPGYTSLETDCQQIKICIQVGLICLNPERTKRPTMEKIIKMLQGLESMNHYISNGYQATPSGEELPMHSLEKEIV